MSFSVDNRTPFPCIGFHQYHRDSIEMAVLSVRGAFELVNDAPLLLAEKQDELELVDRYSGDDPHESSLIRTADLTPYKPASDITVLAAAFAPGGVPKPRWAVGVTIGAVEKVVTVFGPRYWLPDHTFDNPKVAAREIVVKKRNWKMSTSAPAAVAPLTWRQAFGGKLPRPADAEGIPDRCPTNGLGCGLVDAEHSPYGVPLAAPTVEDPADPIIDWGRRDHQPQGFAPIPPWWRQRQQYAGTYDEAWVQDRHPILPEDFDYRFYQYAPPGLIYPGYLRGDETLVLGRMHPDFEQVRVQLPSLHLFATVRWRDGWLEQAALVLDGVHVDFFSHLAKAHLTWRCWVPRREGVKVMELRLEDPKELAEDIARHRDAPRVRGYAPMARGGL
ncbi:MAG: DUF2169 domain-containing protein [Roseiarcus sp.]